MAKTQSLSRLISQAENYLRRSEYARAHKTVLKACDTLRLQKAAPQPKLEEPPSTHKIIKLDEDAPCDQEREFRTFLENNLFGQPDAVNAGIDAYIKSISPLREPDRPSFVVMSLGKSRTGKSELPRLLAQYLHGNRRALVRVNLSQYQHSHQISSLIGAPPSYVGFDQPARFSREKLEESRGNSSNSQIILVLEEMEKAHSAVADVLLGVFDNGEAELANGEKVDFTDVIIFMTSNLAADKLAKLGKAGLGFNGGAQSVSQNQIKTVVERALAKHYRPEFINRIDRMVVYRDLSKEAFASIVDRSIKDFEQQLRGCIEPAERFQLAVDQSAQAFLANSADIAAQAFNETEDGAGSPIAELKRLITTELSLPINRALIKKLIKAGDVVTASHEPGLQRLTLTIHRGAANLPPTNMALEARPGKNKIVLPGRTLGKNTVFTQKSDDPLRPDAIALFSILLEVADKLETTEKFDEACELYNRGAELEHLALLPATIQLQILVLAARSCAVFSQFHEMIKLWKRALAQPASCWITPNFEKILNEFAAVLESNLCHKRATAILEQLKVVQRALHGEDSVRTAETHTRLGHCFYKMRKPASALSEFEEALSIHKKVSSRDDCIASLLCQISGAHRDLGNWELAQEMVHLATLRIQKTPPDLTHALVIEEQAAIAFHSENYREADNLYGQALALMTSCNSANSLAYAGTLSRLAMVHFRQNHIDKAAGELERCLKIYRLNDSLFSLEASYVVNKLAAMYKLQRRLIESAILITHVEDIEARIFAGTPRNTRVKKFEEAVLYQRAGQLNDAEPLFKEVISLSREASATHRAEIVCVCARLFEVEMKLGKEAEAEYYLARAIKTVEKLFGDMETPIRGARILADVFALQGDDLWAESLFAFAFIISKRGGLETERIQIGEAHANLLDDQGRHKEANELRALAKEFQPATPRARAKAKKKRATGQSA